MPLQPISPAPGVVLSASDYASGKNFEYIPAGNTFRQGQGRWTGGSNIEFISGFAQKIAGWVQATTDKCNSIPNCICPWLDNTGKARVGIGAENNLYFLQDGKLTEITPQATVATGSLNNAISTTAGSNIVSVSDTGQSLVNQDWVLLNAPVAVGGLIINGWFQVTNRTAAGYQFISLIAAATTQAGGGGVTTYQYPHTTIASPFTTSAGSAVVTVTQPGHNQLVGCSVYFSGASPVGGLDMNGGDFFVTSVIDQDHYTVTADSPATSSATGGGPTVLFAADVPIQQERSAAGIGYGSGPYGAGNYGTGLQTAAIFKNGWTLAAYGQQLLACPVGGTIYIYDPTTGGRAYPMLNAPLSVNAMFVTPERFVVALGINGIPMALAWCDQNDYTQWTTTPGNTAETQRNLIGGSYFVGGIAIRNGVSLIFSDRCCFEMSYTGSQLIYNTLLIGDNCGLVDATAVCAEGGIAYWMSDQDFWSWNGGVAALPSDDIRAYVFQNVNRSALSRCTASLNRTKRQVRFWYPSSGSVQNDVGMIFQYDQACFSPMNFGRTASSDAEILTTPVSTDANGFIYFDETGVDAAGQPLPYKIQLGMTDISNGDRNADIFAFTPDFQSLTGVANLSILTKFYPQDPITSDGPYQIIEATQRQDLRSNGKIFGFLLSSNDIGTWFRLGVPRLELAPSGARR